MVEERWSSDVRSNEWSAVRSHRFPADFARRRRPIWPKIVSASNEPRNELPSKSTLCSTKCRHKSAFDRVESKPWCKLMWCWLKLISSFCTNLALKRQKITSHGNSPWCASTPPTIFGMRDKLRPQVGAAEERRSNEWSSAAASSSAVAVELIGSSSCVDCGMRWVRTKMSRNKMRNTSGSMIGFTKRTGASWTERWNCDEQKWSNNFNITLFSSRTKRMNSWKSRRKRACPNQCEMDWKTHGQRESERVKTWSKQAQSKRMRSVIGSGCTATLKWAFWFGRAKRRETQFHKLKVTTKVSTYHVLKIKQLFHVNKTNNIWQLLHVNFKKVIIQFWDSKQIRRKLVETKRFDRLWQRVLMANVKKV